MFPGATRGRGGKKFSIRERWKFGRKAGMLYGIFSRERIAGHNTSHYISLGHLVKETLRCFKAT